MPQSRRSSPAADVIKVLQLRAHCRLIACHDASRFYRTSARAKPLPSVVGSLKVQLVHFQDLQVPTLVSDISVIQDVFPGLIGLSPSSSTSMEPLSFLLDNIQDLDYACSINPFLASGGAECPQ